jgi:hypothetical protein
MKKSKPKPAPKPAPNRKRHIMLTLTEPVCRSLRVLGLDPDSKGGVGPGGGGCGSVQVGVALARYAYGIERATRDLAALLNDDEWTFLADAINGGLSLFGDRESTVVLETHRLIAFSLLDAYGSNGLADHWFGDGKGNEATTVLCAKLLKLEPIHGDAIGAAIRYFWNHADDPDIDSRKWWLVKDRLAARG